MKEGTTLPETTSRREFTKAVVTAAVAAPIAAVLASCTKSPENKPAEQAAPAASPSPSGEDHKMDGEGSPITVGGGGGKREKDQAAEPNVACTFTEDADHFPEDPGNPAHGRKLFKNKKGWKIQTFKIRRGNAWTDLSDKLPSNGDCQITIQCAGSNTTVTISGSPFRIEMDTDKYQKQSDGYYRNPEPDEHIIRATLSAGGQVLANETCDAVCTDYVKPDKSTCPST